MSRRPLSQPIVRSSALIILLSLVLFTFTGVTQTRATPTVAAGSSRIYLPLVSSNTPSTTKFVETFDGNPSTPQPWKPTDWDVVVHSRDGETLTKLEPMKAHHGPNCEAPLDANGNLVTHDINGSYEDSVFVCKDHVMTAIKASGYGVIYLTPPAMADFSKGEATIRFDVTTFRSSERDFLDIWLSPWDDNVAVPFDLGDVDLQGWARNAIKVGQIAANGNGTGYMPVIFKDFVNTGEFPQFTDAYNWYTGYESMMTASPQKRTTFELKISRDRLRFGMPGGQVDQNNKPINNGQPFYWFDKKIQPLTWDKAVVQFGHHSYNPEKGCGTPGTRTCSPNTWHWDNISIEPAQLFTIIRGDRRYVGDDSPQTTVNFPEPAPADAYLRFSAVSNEKCGSCPDAGSPPVEVSYDDGRTWQPAQKQAVSHPMTSPFSHAASYWTPIPQGTQRVQFRPKQVTAGGEGVSWQAKDFAIWSQNTTGAAVRAKTTTPDIRTAATEDPFFCDLSKPSSTGQAPTLVQRVRTLAEPPAPLTDTPSPSVARIDAGDIPVAFPDSTRNATSIPLVTPMPLISRGLPAYASDYTNNNLPSKSNDSNYGEFWEAKNTASWIAYDLSSVPLVQRTKVSLIWWTLWPELFERYDTTSAGIPDTYAIEINSAPGKTSAPPQSGWQQLVRITGNTFASRMHDLNINGANWIRFKVDSVRPGQTSGVHLDIDIYNTNQGNTDSWLFLGDSITWMAWYQGATEGDGYFLSEIQKAFPNNAPVITNGGMGGSDIKIVVQNIDQILAAFSGRFVAVSHGTNGGGNPDEYYTDYETVVKAIIKAGKVPIVPKMIWGRGESLTKGPLLNAKIEQLYANYPQIIRGPDLWKAFENRTELFGDNVHPNNEGLLYYRNIWADAMIQNVYGRSWTITSSVKLPLVQQ